MRKSTRRPQQLYAIVMWVLSIVFAGFLLGLGSLVIRDLPSVDPTLSLEQFVDVEAQTRIERSVTLSQTKIRTVEREIEDARADLVTATNDYLAAQSSFQTWIATRSATEAADTNPEVLLRTRQLEALKARERAALAEVEALERVQVQNQRDRSDLIQERNRVDAAAQPAYQAALRAQELRVFLYRLALTLPLLLIGAWMILKKRDSAYWPLYRGFVVFAGFAFFVELVPYLPSYGGYVRFGVGIAVVIIAGHFLIKTMRGYMAKKQEEEARSEIERRQSIGYETALKKIAAKSCPGCDRAIFTRDGVETDFCVHCGIRLADNCGGCGARNISFHRFCLSCGIETTDAPEPVIPTGPVVD